MTIASRGLCFGLLMLSTYGAWCSTLARAESKTEIPLDGQSTNFFTVINTLSPEEQARLQLLLDAQGPGGAFSPATSDTTAACSEKASGFSGIEISAEEIRARMTALRLDTNAAVEDLRYRDKIVALIAGLRDPVQRDRLLHELEAREQQGWVSYSAE